MSFTEKVTKICAIILTLLTLLWPSQKSWTLVKILLCFECQTYNSNLEWSLTLRQTHLAKLKNTSHIICTWHIIAIFPSNLSYFFSVLVFILTLVLLCSNIFAKCMYYLYHIMNLLQVSREIRCSKKTILESISPHL